MAASTKSLGLTAVTALKWNYAGFLARTVCSLVIGIVLARLLGPKPFGEVAIAGLVIGLGTLMSDFGFGAALVQPKEISEHEIRFAFSVQVVLGAVVSAIGFGLAGAIAGAFHQPGVTPVIRVLMLTFVLQSFGLTAASLLRRQLAFKQLQTAQVVSYVASYLLLGIPLAFLGFGVWALVAAQLVQTVLNAALLYNAARHPVRPLLSLRYRRLVGFGGRVITTNLTNWTIFNLDTAIAGRFFGTFDLGLYNRAFFSATTPVSGAVGGLQQVLFPGSARAQNEPEKLKRAYLGAVAILALATMPVYAAIAVAPRTILLALYGPQWTGAAPLLAAFAVAMPFYAMMAIAGPFLWGIGKVGSELRVQLVIAVVAVISFLAAYRISLAALAWAVAAVYFLRFVLITRALLRIFALPWIRAIRAMCSPAAVALITAAAVYGMDAWLVRESAAVLRLGADIVTGALVVLAALAWLPATVFGSDGAWLLNSVRGGLPSFVSRWLPPLRTTAGAAS